MNDLLFELSHLFFTYPQEEKPVLSDLNLKIGAGERICVLGANGCGKTTLLKLLAGLLFPQKGTLRAFNKILDKYTFHGPSALAYHRRVGFVFQEPDVQLFCGTVKEELAFGPLQAGLSEKEVAERVRAVAETVGVEELLDKPPFRLSGGEKRKVAIGSTLILNPDVLILDEPSEGLDPRSQTWLLHLLRALSAAGKTLIVSTHNLELAPHIAQRAILFDEAHRIAADMPVHDLLKQPELLRRVDLVDEHFHTHPWDFEDDL